MADRGCRHHITRTKCGDAAHSPRQGVRAGPDDRNEGLRLSRDHTGALLKPGFLDYYVTIESGSDRLIIPDSHGSWPGDWDFPKSGGYRVPVAAADAPLTLFDAARDGERVIVPYGGY